MLVLTPDGLNYNLHGWGPGRCHEAEPCRNCIETMAWDEVRQGSCVSHTKKQGNGGGLQSLKQTNDNLIYVSGRSLRLQQSSWEVAVARTWVVASDICWGDIFQRHYRGRCYLQGLVTGSRAKATQRKGGGVRDNLPGSCCVWGSNGGSNARPGKWPSSNSDTGTATGRAGL